MPVVNPLAREIVFKIVYYGPGLGGKTTSLQHIHATAKPEHRGKMVSLATPVDRTLYFDFLPIRLPMVRGLGVRLQLFTVPGQVYYNATRKLVLTGADGVVLVVDSQRARIDANVESLLNLKDNLREHGRVLEQVPHVLQYNKRDLPDIAPLEELEQRLNQHGGPSFASVATRGDGVYEALEAISRAVLEDFEERMPEARQLAERQLELPEGGLAEALRQADAAGLGSVASSQSRDKPYERRPSGVLSLNIPPKDPLSHQFGDSEPPFTPRDGTPTSLARAAGVPELEHEPDADSSRGVDEPWMNSGTESQARALAASVAESSGLSFAALWPELERSIVREAEAAITLGRYDLATLRCDALVTRSLASAAAVLGASSDAPRDPSMVALLLGLDGRRYLEFRSAVRAARSGTPVTPAAALAALAFAVEARLARTRVGL
jgi:signal recognition particle receptor subunit beta